MRKIHKLTIIILLLLFLVVAIGWRNSLSVQYYAVSTEKLHEQIRIALISDLHSCYFGSEQEVLIQAIDAEKPDFILYTGDIADDKIPHDGTLDLLKGLQDKYPAFYVTGNHEIWSGEVEQIQSLFQDYGVVVLSNVQVQVSIGDQRLLICGVEDPAKDGVSNYKRQLDFAFDGANNPMLYTILLAHRPEWIEEYLNYPCDLILSGHAHGGQFRIPGVINGIYAPGQGFLPRYAGGVYTHGKTVHVVSRGLATKSTRLPRLYNPPELVIVDLMPESKQ